MSTDLFEERPILIPALITAIMLILAIGPWPYGYYVLLRWVVCGAAIFVIAKAAELKKFWVICLFAFIALLFNPLIPVHLTRELWLPIDIIFSIIFIIYGFILRESM